MNVRNGQKMGILKSLFCLMVVIFFGISNLYAGPDEALVAAARKEGKLSFYAAMLVTDAVFLARNFEAKYPGIKVDVTRLPNQDVLNRIVNEHRAQRHVFDVVSVNTQILTTLKEEGILGRYISPESKIYPEGTKDSDGYWTGIYYNVGVIAYNTKLVSPKDAPKTYEDLMQPKWRGKNMKNRLVPHWYALMIQQIGKEKAESIARRLAANGLIYRDNATLIAQLVAAGEVLIGFPLYGYSVEDLKLKGAQIDWNRPDPVFTSLSGMAISGKSSHPNAAKLFADYILSEAGQDHFAQLGKDPPRPGARHPIPKLVEGITFPKVKLLSTREYAEVTKEYREIFKPR